VNSPTGYPVAGEVVSGKYRIDRVLGEGGMGAVVRATHLITRVPVALKFMSPQFMRIEGAVERFLKEGEAAGRIRSEHVVQIYDVDKLKGGAPYIAMECLDGRDLQQLIEAAGGQGLPVTRTITLMMQVLRGLQAAHAVGIVHRDMKPSNCFAITRDGEPDFVKLLDFGISKVSQPGQAGLTKTNSALGTPLYMAPEQASSPRGVDHRCDIYSAGVILYEMLCGETPFTSESGELTEILFKLFTADIPPLQERRPDLPAELCEVVHQALRRDPAERISSALAFAEALAPFGDARAQGLLEKMRNYMPPSLDETDMGDHTAAIDAFKQLEGKAWTIPATAPETIADFAPDTTGPLSPSIPGPAKVPNESAGFDRTVQADLAPAPAAKQTAIMARPSSRPSTPYAGEVPVDPPRKSSNAILIAAIAAVLVVGGGAAALGLSGATNQKSTGADAPPATSASAPPQPSAATTSSATAATTTGTTSDSTATTATSTPSSTSSGASTAPTSSARLPLAASQNTSAGRPTTSAVPSSHPTPRSTAGLNQGFNH
jgi:serine/threonine-protein kinase